MVATVAEKKDEKVEKRRALGRGLASLLPGPRAVVNAEPRVATDSTAAVVDRTDDGSETKVPRFARDDKHEQVAQPATQQTAPAAIPIQVQQHVVAMLDVELIEKNPYQTRYVFDEEMLAELADSIRENGVVQPVVVRPAEESGRYVLVLGERRLRASKMAGKQTIPALVRRLSPQQAAEMTVLENVQREDLNPIEQAEAFRVLSKEFHLTQAQIAERIGVSRETVANHMRLLRLPQEVMGYLVSGRLSFSDCRELLALQNEEHILQVAQEVVTKHLKWDEIEDRVARLNGFIPGQTAGESQK
ncbi:MAG: ParB/RepB/Spo0J family partition protein, partial [Candidatus Sulfotelmatobacter sp.]